MSHSMKVWRQKNSKQISQQAGQLLLQSSAVFGEKKALKVKIIWTVQGMTDNWKLQRDPQYNSSVSWLH